jgi:WD domain, G-beta repeat
VADNVPLDGIVLHGSAVGAALTYGNNNTITIIYGSEGLGRAVSELSHRAPPELGEIGPNPYRGLNAFDEASSHLFFGREELTGDLVKKLRELWRQSGQRVRLLAIMGPSGCGKSSVARAGIVPRLAKGDVPGLENATVAILQPGPHPAEALALALARLATGNPTPAAKAREFGDELALPGVEGQLDGLSRLARMLCPSNKPLIILVDQFEETWTLCQPADPRDAVAAKRAFAERAVFVRTLMHAAAEPNGQVIVLLTLRSDFFGVTAEFPEMNRAIATGHEIAPVMSQGELRAAIAEPARVAKRPLAGAAVSRMLGEVEGEDSSLPLLQFVLHQIWEGFRQARSENDTLDALQGVGGALAFRAEELLQDVLDERGRRLVRRAFEEMVQLGEGVRDTRRRVRLSDMVPQGATEADLTEALEPFVAERLVSKGSDEEGQITAELAHEALIQHWQTLRRWIDDRRADLRFGRRVQQAATEWWDSGRLVGRLWRPPDLDRLRDFARRSPQNLTEQGAEFLRRSERGRKQQQWIRRSVVGAITVLFFVATAFGFYSQHEARVAESATVEATEQKNQAREAADRAQRATADAKEQRNLAEEQNTRAQEQRTQALLQESQAVSILSRQATARGDPMTGMLSALEVLPDPAIGRVRPVSNAASSALLDAWLHNRELADLLGHTGFVSSAAFSPDGQRVVTASKDYTARVWDLSGPRPVATVLEGHIGPVRSATFSPDGKRVVTASFDHTARVWDLSGPRPVATVLDGHAGDVSSATFSPDGKRVVTASDDHTARVWDLSGPRPVATVLAAFSPDGKRVVTASFDHTARVWDLSGPRPVATVLDGHAGDVSSATFSPDGKRVVTASDDHTARVVSVPSVDMLVKEATRSLTRCLTIAQREELGLPASSFALVDHEVGRYEVTAPPCI